MGESVEMTVRTEKSLSWWEKVPQALVKYPQWVGWRYEDRPGKDKPAKVPINPRTGRNADVSNRDTWGNFEQAVERYEKDGLDGVGFVLTDDDPFVCVDVDNCRDAKTGQVKEDAEWLLTVIQSYGEVSPSGTGVHIWVLGKIPRNARRDRIEIYGSRRFITVTGRELNGLTQSAIGERDQALESLFSQVAGESEGNDKNNSTATRSLSGDQRTKILQGAAQGQDGAKFRRLWSGDWTGYASQSEGDLALCRILALHCGYRRMWIDDLFRESALFREKWDRAGSDSRTYGRVTIGKGISQARFELKRRWGVLSSSDAEKVDPKNVDYLVEDIVPRQILGVLAGDSGLGKSSLLYQLGLCVASGTDFLGRRVKRGRVLYLDYENGAGEARRIIEGILTSLRLEEPAESFLYWTQDRMTSRWSQRSGPYKIIQDFRPDLVIIDSLSAFDPRMEETNSNANRTVAALRGVSRDYGCAVLLTHHLAKPQKGRESEPLETCDLNRWFFRTRGASALINSTDVRLGVAKPSRRPASATQSVQETALVLRGFARVRGEIPLMYVARIFDEQGQAMGYRNLTGSQLLFNSDQEAAFKALRRRFRFKDARLAYGRGDQATADFLKKCEALQIVRKVKEGYEKIKDVDPETVA